MTKAGPSTNNAPLTESSQAVSEVWSALKSGDTVRLEALQNEYLTRRQDKETAQGKPSHPNDTIKLDPEQKSGVYEPQRLIALYLQGKLSQGELAFHLRAYNSVVADTIMRQSRVSTTAPIDYIEVPQPSMAKPGGVYHEPHHASAKEKNQGGGFSPEVEENTKGKDKDEEQQQKQQQQDDRQDAIRLQFTEQNNQEVLHAQLLKELHDEELLRQEGYEHESNSLVDGALEGADRAKTGVTDAIRKRSPHHKRHSARQAFLDETQTTVSEKKQTRDKQPTPPPPVSVS
jgi:hypothetical protein